MLGADVDSDVGVERLVFPRHELVVHRVHSVQLPRLLCLRQQTEPAPEKTHTHTHTEIICKKFTLKPVLLEEEMHGTISLYTFSSHQAVEQI